MSKPLVGLMLVLAGCSEAAPQGSPSYLPPSSGGASALPSGGGMSALPSSGGMSAGAAGSSGGSAPVTRAQGIRESYAKGEIRDLCGAAVAAAEARLNEVANVPAAERSDPDKTILAFEGASAEFYDQAQPLIFMGYVSPDADVRDEAFECEVKVGEFGVDVNLRRDIYDAIKGAVPRSPDEARLLSDTLTWFTKNGLNLDDAKLAELKALMQQLSTLEAQFSQNLDEDVTTVQFTKDQLAGLPDSFFTTHQPDASGLYTVTTDESEYWFVASNAAVAATRETLLRAYWSRAGEANTQLLNQAIQLRQKIAGMLSYGSWADYRIDGGMAGNAKNVLDLLVPLKDKLAARSKKDLEVLLEAKKAVDPSATAIEAWDVAYFAAQVQSAKFQIDQEKVREYFPADVVMQGMLDVYSTLLGVRFNQIQNAKVWDPGVKQYEIRNSSDNAVIGYFYTDLAPRDGKYGHAAAFPLISGRLLKDGQYNYPVAAIVANFSPPSGDQPSLLAHDEVETLFHEFGHIMHQTLTKAPYASLSGTAVAWDFVEAPSQMLENWAWSPQILGLVSGHYQDHTQKLPADVLQSLVAARSFNQGYKYTWQLSLALTDLEIHSTNGPVDVDQVYNRVYEQSLGIKPVSGNHFMATFGHMMGGYDAGYYGYLWSEVYAADMFTQFQGNLLDPNVGARYRSTILERGHMVPALSLVEQFLGRPVNSDAFDQKLGF